MKNTVPIDNQVKTDLRLELKRDQTGQKLEHIQTGISGKALNVDGFKFDDNFGKKYHQTSNDDKGGFDFDFNFSNKPQTNTFAPSTQSDPFKEVNSNPYGQQQKSNSTQSASTNYFQGDSHFGAATQSPPGKIGGQGFLDFEGFGGGSTPQPAQTANQKMKPGFNPFN